MTSNGAIVMGILAKISKERADRLHRLNARPFKKLSTDIHSPVESLDDQFEGLSGKVLQVDLDIKSVTLEEVVKAICSLFSVDPSQIIDKNRKHCVVLPRHLVYYLAYEGTDCSFPAIGRALNRDHSTVIYAHKKIANLIQTDETVASHVEKLRMELGI